MHTSLRKRLGCFGKKASHIPDHHSSSIFFYRCQKTMKYMRMNTILSETSGGSPMQNKNISVKTRRYNIYSCLSLLIADTQICFDPAKIRREELDTINPDAIFISHESIDHMDPIQVYFLQKKKKCLIFCSIAAAIDLAQYFAHDIDFVDSLTVLIPGCELVHKNMKIETAKSIHCDYMLPLVYKITYLDTGVSILHCFDTHLSEEIVKLSIGTDVSIIPIGIAKGVSPTTGQDFVQKLHSKAFITNHFKTENELQEFVKLIKASNSKATFSFLNWNESGEIQITPTHLKKENPSISFEDVYDSLFKHPDIPIEYLKLLLIDLNTRKCALLHDKKLMIALFASYHQANDEKKIILLIIFSMISLVDPYLIQKEIIACMKSDLLSSATITNNSLKVVALFFLGLYSQQMAKITYLDEVKAEIHEDFDHVTYWIVEFLGRSATSRGSEFQKAIDLLLYIIQKPKLYHSVVVRRKLFWELYRIMQYIPHVAHQFFQTFEDGLSDSNPDVRLLATLCFGLANRIEPLTTQQILKIFNLFQDPEDDVRETAVRVVEMLIKHHKNLVLQHMDAIDTLLKDTNCHVQRAAQETRHIIMSL